MYLNILFLDKFWNNIKEDIWIYIDDNMLKYIGYNCERESDSIEETSLTLDEDF